MSGFLHFNDKPGTGFIHTKQIVDLRTGNFVSRRRRRGGLLIGSLVNRFGTIAVLEYMETRRIDKLVSVVTPEQLVNGGGILRKFRAKKSPFENGEMP